MATSPFQIPPSHDETSRFVTSATGVNVLSAGSKIVADRSVGGGVVGSHG